MKHMCSRMVNRHKVWEWSLFKEMALSKSLTTTTEDADSCLTSSTTLQIEQMHLIRPLLMSEWFNTFAVDLQTRSWFGSLSSRHSQWPRQFRWRFSRPSLPASSQRWLSFRFSQRLPVPQSHFPLASPFCSLYWVEILKFTAKVFFSDYFFSHTKHFLWARRRKVNEVYKSRQLRTAYHKKSFTPHKFANNWRMCDFRLRGVM